MAYNRTLWLDRSVQRPRTYTVTVNEDGSITLTDAPGTVHETGTPLSATNFNNVENALQDLAVAFDYWTTIAQAEQRALRDRIEQLEQALTALASS